MIPDCRLVSIKIWDFWLRIDRGHGSENKKNSLHYRALKIFQASASRQYTWLEQNMQKLQEELTASQDSLSKREGELLETKRKLKEANRELKRLRSGPKILTDYVAKVEPHLGVKSASAPMLQTTSGSKAVIHQETPEQRPWAPKNRSMENLDAMLIPPNASDEDSLGRLPSAPTRPGLERDDSPSGERLFP